MNRNRSLKVITLLLSGLLCAPTAFAVPQAQGAGPDMAQAAVKRNQPKAAAPDQARQLVQVQLIRGSHVRSPKSVIFHPNNRKFYVNALEGMETLVYDADTLQMTKVISHTFTAASSRLFKNGEESCFDYPFYHGPAAGKRNIFGGKPVESALSHGGKYLWVTYYRRTYDANASCPSAVAIIDTATDSIVRVMPTAPLPKMIVPSPDGTKMAVIHWGDNSVGIIDISGEDPDAFHWSTLLQAGPRPDLSHIAGDRDRHCGLCLRGAAFTSDSRYLLVGRMHNGGIDVFDMSTMKNLGTYGGIAPTPRHIVRSHDGKTMYVSSAASGVVTALDTDRVIEAVKTKTAYKGREVFVGNQVRTIALSPNGHDLYAACNRESKLVRVDTRTLKVTGQIAVPIYAVGAAVRPDGSMIVTTSQGRSGHGGHVIGVFREKTR